MGVILDILVFLLKFIFSVLVFLIVLGVLSFIIWFLYYRVVKRLKFPKSVSNYKPVSVFKRIFIQFPQQFWLDRFNRLPRRIFRIWFTSYLWRARERKNDECSRFVIKSMERTISFLKDLYKFRL